MKTNRVHIIENSKVFTNEVKKLNKKEIEYERVDGENYICLVTNHHSYLFYSSKQNVNHIFFVRVFGKDNIQQRLISKTSKNVTEKTWHNKDIVVYKDEKISTYRNTDVGNTTNVHRVENTNETLGYPFKRKISFAFIKDSKDRLQYRRECIELSKYNRQGKRKKMLDDVFCTRVLRLFLNLKGHTNTEIYNILRAEETISGYAVVEIMEYLYQVISSYHPYFYHKNGTCKYNKYILKEQIRQIKQIGLLDCDYTLCKVNRNVHKDSNQIKQEDVQDWLKQRQALLDKGELWEDID